MSVCAFCLALPAAVCDRLASWALPSILLPPRLDTSLQEPSPQLRKPTLKFWPGEAGFIKDEKEEDAGRGENPERIYTIKTGTESELSFPENGDGDTNPKARPWCSARGHHAH